jgi:hypothetical protein
MCTHFNVSSIYRKTRIITFTMQGIGCRLEHIVRLATVWFCTLRGWGQGGSRWDVSRHFQWAGCGKWKIPWVGERVGSGYLSHIVSSNHRRGMIEVPLLRFKATTKQTNWSFCDRGAEPWYRGISTGWMGGEELDEKIRHRWWLAC